MKIEIHAKSNCPYCHLAKNHLINHYFSFDEILYDEDDDRQMMYDQFGLTGDQRTVPQIVLTENDGTKTRIGGYTDLIESAAITRHYVGNFDMEY